MKKILSIILVSVCLISCSSKGTSPVTEDEEIIILSDENIISQFRLNINGNSIDGNINQLDREITFDVRGADLSALTPSITYPNSATISPFPGVLQDFSVPVNYIVTAENGDPKVYTVTVTNTPFSTEKSITKFTIMVNGQEILGDIDENEKTISLSTDDIDLSNISPTIEISDLATISPLSDVSLNFQNEVTYTVSAEDGSSVDYIVQINWPKFDVNGFANEYYFYIGADFIIRGEYLNTNNGGRLYLSDGNSSYDINVINTYLYSQGTNIYSHEFKIPNNMDTSIYKLYYERNSIVIEHPSNFDVDGDNVPTVTSTNQSSYFFNDTMIINGENLTPAIMIPSNGSLYLINAPSSTYNYTLSPDKTQIQLELGNYQLFPSYYGNSPEVKSIRLIADGGRRAASFDVTFN